MGKAGKALKQVLVANSISQSKIASALGVERPIVFRWFHEQVDPAAETVAKIVDVLRKLNPDAATEFIHLYLGNDLSYLHGRSSKVSIQNLPDSEQLNIAALSRLFTNTTNSYKYLFFLSLLDILNRRNFEVLSPISFQELVVEMLANAWYPHTFFKLDFGRQDKISQKLDSLQISIEEPIVRFKDPDKKLLRRAIASHNLKDAVFHLGRYVPFRLIVPFLNSELENINRSKGDQVDLAIPAIAERYFDECKPLYKFNSTTKKDCQSITVHPAWTAYLEKHHDIIRSWLSWNWTHYMQKRNPSTPAIINKLFVPVMRDSLGKQADYWRMVLRAQEIRCIYSQKVINPKKLSVDHYIPWSFVGHDHLWNLIPTLPSINSSKSNRLPSALYFRAFVELQHTGLTTTYRILSESQWTRQVEPYVVDLKMDNKEELLQKEKLCNAYDQLINPLISLASNQGFSPDWAYTQ